jgi:cysteinyl-tRNA synthetase
MSLRYLGDTLDIHGGGQDLIFPHHQNEIAQSESFSGKRPFVKYWLHNGLVQLGEEKMSKSLGNLITIKQALENYSPDALRLFVLSSHYRSPLKYSEEALEAAAGGAARLLRVISRDSGGKGEALGVEPYRQRFIEAMDDDFNTPQALGVLFDLARKINETGDAGLSFANAQNALLSLAREVLGLTLKPVAFVEPEEPVTKLIEERNRLREAKKWREADKIRAKLDEMGVTLEDTAEGTIIRAKRKR